jgi:NAD(P)-dependent dehydrogenase (short-subunit alcohol dehydrogenase family)
MNKQVILVTGASSGFGLMSAQYLARAGHTVYASMRATLIRPRSLARSWALSAPPSASAHFGSTSIPRRTVPR